MSAQIATLDDWLQAAVDQQALTLTEAWKVQDCHLLVSEEGWARFPVELMPVLDRLNLFNLEPVNNLPL